MSGAQNDGGKVGWKFCGVEVVGKVDSELGDGGMGLLWQPGKMTTARVTVPAPLQAPLCPLWHHDTCSSCCCCVLPSGPASLTCSSGNQPGTIATGTAPIAAEWRNHGSLGLWCPPCLTGNLHLKFLQSLRGDWPLKVEVVVSIS